MTVKNVFLFHFACRHAMSRLRKFSFDLCGFGFMRLLQVADDNKMLICESRRQMTYSNNDNRECNGVLRASVLSDCGTSIDLTKQLVLEVGTTLEKQKLT
jgi:hypothetical protein